MPFQLKTAFPVMVVSLGSCAALLLAGCTLENTAAPSADLVPATAISGTVHGGSQSIFGAKVYLLAVSPNGYGGPGIAASSSNASVSLLTPLAGSATPDTIGYYATTNNTTGGFSLSGAGVYSCTSGYTQGATVATVTLSGTEQVYLYVLGGQAANIASANTSSGLLVALGPCSSHTTQVEVNEMTTTATAYAFAGFATDATHIGSSGSTLALTNLSNAFLNVANLTTVSTGSAAAGGSGTTTPSANINTIADILASCVDGLTNNSNCQKLFTYTESAGATGTAPSDTATAAINLAHNPYPISAGMTALYGLQPATGAPFQTALSSAPNDFTLGLNYTGGGLNQPHSVAIDATGNAWIANAGNNSVSKFSSTGTALSGSSGYTGGGSIETPYGIAIDASGNVWTANLGNSVSKLSSTGTAVSGGGYYHGGGLSSPYGIAIDASGNAWIANEGSNSVSEFSGTGTAITNADGYTGGGIEYPYGIAIDASGNVWAANWGNSSVSKLSSTGAALSGTGGYTGGGVSSPRSIAVDASGNVWTANPNNSVTKLSSTGTAISPSTGYTGGGLDRPDSIAIDGSGNAWITNVLNNSVSKLSSTGAAISGSNGYTGGGIDVPEAIAIDGSGNVWTANESNNSVTELIGTATPVVTPVVANLVSPYAANASAVNRP